jgi:peptidoglycan/LPS O-acetylase OafA/YrhL
MDRKPVGRIESLDLLRGLCAIGVACYHVMSWLGVATVHDLGLYGVYLFFLLSGASMTIAYARRFADGYPVTSYLALRYIRLAPLYVLAATYVAIVDLRSLYTLPQLVGRWLLNVTFLFGVANPGDTSLIVGGWSLGIEFDTSRSLGRSAPVRRAVDLREPRDRRRPARAGLDRVLPVRRVHRLLRGWHVDRIRPARRPPHTESRDLDVG